MAKGRWSNPLPPDADVVATYLSGVSLHRLAGHYHVGYRRVSAIIQAAGLTGYLDALSAQRRRGQAQPAHLKTAAVASNVTRTQWAYIAGLFDGEGSVRGGLTVKGCLHTSISIVQKDPTVLTWLCTTLGSGRVEPNGGRPSHPTPTYRYTLQARVPLFAFLVGVAPYTIVKRTKVNALGHLLADRYGWLWVDLAGAEATSEGSV